ncbi:MAG: periplasmic binding protein [Actinomycetia bacterium]|nr:periplasmic binding protein [Actinomycetes bacterium]
MHRRSLLTTWLLSATLAVSATACGSSSTTGSAAAPTTTTAAGAAFPATVTGDNGAVAIAAKPARIVSLSPSATEDLFAIGAGKQVVAVDDQSNYPAEAPHTKLSGFSPNV